MALGNVNNRSNSRRDVELLSGATANVAAPTLATQGVPMYQPGRMAANAPDAGVNYPGQPLRSHRLYIAGTVTAGQTLVGTFTLWGWLETAQAWFRVPVNAGTPLAETGNDVIGYTELINGLSHFDRLAISLDAIGGTGASFSAWIGGHAETF